MISKRLAPRLGVVPGVEQGLLVMVLGIVEQPPAGLAHEDPAEQAAARLARAGDQGRHHRPERPAGEMVEGGAIGVGEEEVLLLVGHRPGERQRDLVQVGGSVRILKRVAVDHLHLPALRLERGLERGGIADEAHPHDRGAAEREAGGDRRGDAVRPG